MLFEADYAKNYASIMYQRLDVWPFLSLARGVGLYAYNVNTWSLCEGNRADNLVLVKFGFSALTAPRFSAFRARFSAQNFK